MMKGDNNVKNHTCYTASSIAFSGNVFDEKKSKWGQLTTNNQTLEQYLIFLLAISFKVFSPSKIWL